MAISTLAYKITADTAGFTKNVQASKRELTLAKRVMTETKTDSQRLGEALNALEQIYNKGLLPTEQYRLAQQKVKDEISGASKATGTMNKAFGNVPSVLKSIAGPLGIATSGFAAVGLILRGLTTSLEELDRLGKQSRQLGLDPTVLRGFEFSAEKAGLKTGEFVKSFEKMLDTIGGTELEGPLGDKRAKALFELLELDLTGKSPADQFLDIADAISKLDTQAKKTDVAKFIFGRGGGKELELFGAGREVLEADLATVIQRRGRVDTAAVEKMKDDAAEASLYGEGFFAGADVALSETSQPFRQAARAASEKGVSGADVGGFAANYGTTLGILFTLVSGIVNSVNEVGKGIVKELDRREAAANPETLKQIERNTRTPVVNEETNI